MRILPALLLLAFVAGCAAPAAPPAAAADPRLGGWALDCGIGADETNAGRAWLQPCEARASHTVGPKQEIWLAVNPTNPENVVLSSKDNDPASSASCTWNGLAVTHDGGATWRDVTIGGRYLDRKPTELWYGYACNTDPMFRFARNGDLHYAVELYSLGAQSSHGILGASPTTGRPYTEPGWRLLLATSHDGGDTWPDVVDLVDGDGEVALNDYSRMTISPTTGSILTAIGFLSGTDFTIPALGAPDPAGGTATQAATHSYCWVTASRDGGKTADPAMAVVQNPPAGVACQVIAAEPDGTIVLGGEPGGSAVGGKVGAGHIGFAASTDDGKTFGAFGGGFDYVSLPGHFNNTKFRTGSTFELVADSREGPHKGRLYVAYSEEAPTPRAGGGVAAGHAEIHVRHSDDKGATWSPAVRMGGGNSTHDQFEPQIVTAADGSLHGFYMDRRYDPQNRLIGITHAVSLDDGATWTDEPVTTVPFDGDLGVHQEGFPFIGDYIGADSVGNVVWGGFPDASNGATTVIAAAKMTHSGPSQIAQMTQS